MPIPTWKYVGTSEPERLAVLSSPLPFLEVVDRLKREMRIVCFHRQERTEDISYSRAVFCVQVGPSLFDSFFNSTSGYRASYFVGPEAGLEANRVLLKELSPTLISWAIRRHSGIDRDWLIESLSLPSAKAWLAEETLSLCSECAGEWSTSYVSELEIANGRWECSDHAHAAWGRQAPRLTKVRIFGGFVNHAHQEWVADHKQKRAQQIWEHGWS